MNNVGTPEQAEQEKQQTSRKKKHPRLQSFFENFFLWIFGAAISVVPICLKHTEIAAAANFSEPYDFWGMVLSDYDFSFISINALFILALEGYLLIGTLPAWKKSIIIATFVCFAATGAVYCACYTYRDHFAFFWRVTQHDYNMITLGLTAFFGIVCHITYSR